MGVISVESSHRLPILGSDECDCCETNDRLTDESSKAYGCHERRTVFTPREEEVLKRLRELGPKVRSIKDQIKLLEETGSADIEAKHRAMEELESLRQLRSQLDAERIAAAEERMRLLGHA
jgi:hypothetical protein